MVLTAVVGPIGTCRAIRCRQPLETRTSRRSDRGPASVERHATGNRYDGPIIVPVKLQE